MITIYADGAHSCHIAGSKRLRRVDHHVVIGRGNAVRALGPDVIPHDDMLTIGSTFQ